MSLANENMQQLLAAAKGLPGELSLREVELIFLNPTPIPPAAPWYGSYLKFFTMLSILLALTLTVTVTSAKDPPTLTAFPIALAAPSPKEVIDLPLPATPATRTLESPQSAEPNLPKALPTASFAPPPYLAPAAPPETKEVTTPHAENPPAEINPATQKLTGPSQITLPKSERLVAPIQVDDPPLFPGQKTNARRYASPDALQKPLLTPEPPIRIPQKTLPPVKWGLEQAGYMADTLNICSRNDRTCTMELKLKGKFRLMLNPKMDAKNMILYARPEAIASMIIKDGFRKMALRNTSKEQVIDVEINPTALEGFRIKENVELIDHEE